MPYIDADGRKRFQPHLDELLHEIHERGLAPGELNYIITILALAYLTKNGVNYTTMNAIIGALDCAKMEFYRKFVVPYEEKKEMENGAIAGAQAAQWLMRQTKICNCATIKNGICPLHGHNATR